MPPVTPPTPEGRASAQTEIRRWLGLTVGDARGTMVWLSASLMFAAFCALLGLIQAFERPYIVQDDAEQHVWWMLRFVDPGLFPGSLAADYYASVAPPGYAAIYRVFAALGVDPILLNKLLPMALGLIATYFGFRLVMRLMPVPFAAFAATALLNLRLWMLDDLVSGTARSFCHPLLLAFLYYVAAGARWRCFATIALTGLIYPQMVILQAGVLLVRLLAVRPVLRLARENVALSLGGVGVAGLTLLPFALHANAFGPVVTAAMARTMPEWGPTGRHHFYKEFWSFWIAEDPSGMLPFMGSTPPLMLAGLLWPLLLWRRQAVPYMGHLGAASVLLVQLAVASLGLFAVAHAVLFHLYLPSRYTQHSAWILLAIAAGVVLASALDLVISRIERRHLAPGMLTAVLFTLGIVLMLPVTHGRFPRDSFEEGGTPGLYQYLQQQPKDILIASLCYEADRIPTFTRRTVLVSPEVSVAFHVGYHRQMRARAIALLEAQYSPDLEPLMAVIRHYGIDFWLLDRHAFEPRYLAEHAWLQQFEPTLSKARMQLAAGRRPALEQWGAQRVVYEDERFILIATAALPKSPTMLGGGGRRTAD